jgi:hypothetical protein
MPTMTRRALERMRRHREEMELAIAEQLTLDQARRICAERRRLRRSATRSTLPLPASAPPSTSPSPPAQEPAQPWWMRD